MLRRPFQMSDRNKLLPRNATAWSNELVSGNPVTSRLESGVGNCFPGLEFDVRNLERRFFPFLAVDFVGSIMLIVEVDLEGAQAAGLPPDALETYDLMAQNLADPTSEMTWIVNRIVSNFGPFGDLDLTSEMLSTDRTDVPDDAWTAVRLIPQNSDVTIQLIGLTEDAVTQPRLLVGQRSPYLDENGVLTDTFLPGELTQSLCSPWTHDFRDCGCYYWSSNHPDIAQPQKPAGIGPDQRYDQAVDWQRSDRGTLVNPSTSATESRGDEMRHYEISHRWQELGIVLDGREQSSVYVPTTFSAEPFQSTAELVAHTRYAAGVELAVILEYLAAAYSLDRNASGGTLADDVNASFAEILRIAIGEMKHIRAANDMLRAFSEHGLTPDFTPALQVAADLPTGGTSTRPLAFRRLTMQTLDSFIDIERPSFSVDGLYGRILETVRIHAPGPLEAVVEAIMADGTDHFDTFSFIKEWLGRHDEEDYLLDLSDPDGSPDDANLQTAYEKLLNDLHTAYAAGLPAGADLISQTQTDMLARPDGIRGLCEALTQAGLQIRFVAPPDPRFAPIGVPGAGL